MIALHSSYDWFYVVLWLFLFAASSAEPYPQFTFCLIFMTGFPLEGLGIFRMLKSFPTM